jgi:hypothetical protein
VYFLCLIDWKTKILNPDELKEFTDKIMGPSASNSDDWKIKPLNWQGVEDIVYNVELGFYHSRLIFYFSLKSIPHDIIGIRKIRKRLESKIEDFCLNKVIPVIKLYNEEVQEPYIFIYPIFELNRRETFWKFRGQRPYSLPTTCFFTELDDLKGRKPIGKKVKMRISGAKIISSEMSDWFFNNLVNIVFHEGLYRQTRDKNKGILAPQSQVYKGLENRLEDFASRLMTTFHEFSSEHVRRRIAKIAAIASIVGIGLTFLNLLLNLKII